MTVNEFAKPFRHWIAEKVVADELIESVADQLERRDWPGWVRYENPLEQKSTCRDARLLPPAALHILDHLQSESCTAKLRDLTGIPDLIPAPFLHGGGIHCMSRGDHLEPHIDYGIHPKARFLERRINLVLCVNRIWMPHNGGQLELWNKDATKVEAEINVSRNRAVIWEASDIAFHSVKPVIGERMRATIAVYYCAPARPGVNRLRALFAPRRS